MPPRMVWHGPSARIESRYRSWSSVRMNRMLGLLLLLLLLWLVGACWSFSTSSRLPLLKLLPSTATPSPRLLLTILLLQAAGASRDARTAVLADLHIVARSVDLALTDKNKKERRMRNKRKCCCCQTNTRQKTRSVSLWWRPLTKALVRGE